MICLTCMGQVFTNVLWEYLQITAHLSAIYQFRYLTIRSRLELFQRCTYALTPMHHGLKNSLMISLIDTTPFIFVRAQKCIFEKGLIEISRQEIELFQRCTYALAPIHHGLKSSL